ncbi:undecaprenyldiphospho-muramoylpentapeptide beta-N-acetylglucosaminyltransferase [Candidatus Bodocaedibacter vickermanii]|uniref:UDP-N-acetylglucosamine--N-acetylmuramyl-(pentapeptide) pyrophosphoryl-undecaprenol N-acetylglucosamine transferase n=1 Tax=Candidatus Bodocaedibacter vickermanii TaxID=2741701 RepID=A0A7L9RV40_9PROT|nr:UDP-N-acetylglucosamine--N-acetylmuramyl-(pentapeptide) pyrophosphoryl-undecaprenol N-acetylglucosamine transferase [Candidatus Paracaedibacteraceae bacterium 'Lake Konstanz']
MASTIILAAGGTGGHIFPAEAIATALTLKGHKVIFITDRAGRKFDRLPPSVQIMVLPMCRRKNSFIGMAKFGWGLLRSMYHVYRGYKMMKPSIVIGFGGYPAFPPVVVAQGLKIPTILHEQNAVLGQVNRILCKGVKHLALSFDNTQKVETKASVTVTGTPVRDVFYEFRETDYAVFDSNEKIHVLVTGGSQGAKVFSTVIPKAIAKLPEALKHRLSIIHQCPKGDVDSLSMAYKDAGVQAEVVDFIENMSEQISTAHLVIARAGASTLAELEIIGRPVILVPFPGAKDDHQWVNAQHIQQAKAGWCVRQHEFTSDYLANQLECLINDPKLLYDAAIKMKALGRTTSTEDIINLIETELNKDR